MFSWKPSVGVQTAHKFLPISTSPVSVYRTIRLLFGRPHIGFFIWIQVRSQFDEIKRENALTSSRGRRGKALRNVFINRIADNFYTGKRAVCDWKYCIVIDVFLNKKLMVFPGNTGPFSLLLSWKFQFAIPRNLTQDQPTLMISVIK